VQHVRHAGHDRRQVKEGIGDDIVTVGNGLRLLVRGVHLSILRILQAVGGLEDVEVGGRRGGALEGQLGARQAGLGITHGLEGVGVVDGEEHVTGLDGLALHGLEGDDVAGNGRFDDRLINRRNLAAALNRGDDRAGGGRAYHVFLGSRGRGMGRLVVVVTAADDTDDDHEGDEFA